MSGCLDAAGNYGLLAKNQQAVERNKKRL